MTRQIPRRSITAKAMRRRPALNAKGSVSGKVAFITGGAAGVGAEVARRLHANGAQLILVDADADALASFATSLRGERVLLRADRLVSGCLHGNARYGALQRQQGGC